ncbi:hypothetical protein ISCGN_027201 [Ixodes scapularis]
MKQSAVATATRSEEEVSRGDRRAPAREKTGFFPDSPIILCSSVAKFSEGGYKSRKRHHTDPKKQGARISVRPTKKFPSTSVNLDLDDPNFEDALDLVPDARLGAGLGSACSHDDQCNSAFGFTCLKSQAAISVCACSSLTPIHINDGGQGRCVRAKAMYESCMSNQECSYENPNVQCVDFLCYCPLPFELTDLQQCLPPRATQSSLVFAIMPTVILALVLLMLGGVYAYQKLYPERSDGSSTGDARDTTSTCTTRRLKSPTRVHRQTEPNLSLRRPAGDERTRGPSRAWDTKHGPRYVGEKNRKTSIPISDNLSTQRGSSPVDHRQLSPRESRRTQRPRHGRLEPVLEEPAGRVPQKDSTSSGNSEKNSQELRGCQRQSKSRSSPLTELYLAKDDKLRNVLRMEEIVINVEPQEPSKHGSPALKASPKALPPRWRVWVQFCWNTSLQYKTPQQLRERARCRRCRKDAVQSSSPGQLISEGEPTLACSRRTGGPTSSQCHTHRTTEQDVRSNLTALTSSMKTCPPTRVQGYFAARTEGKGKMDVLRAKLRQLRKHNKRLQQRLQRRRHMLTVTEIVERVSGLESPAVAALVEAQLKMSNASRAPPRMPSAPASPSPTVRKRPEAVVRKSKEVSFMTELQNRLRMRALRAAEVPVPELHRSLQQHQQQRATSAEMHGKGAAVQTELLPSMLDPSQQVSQLQAWDVKFRTHAPVHRSSLDKEPSSPLQADPQSRLLKTSAASGKVRSKAPSLQKCRVEEDATPDVKELSKMTDLQSSEISVNYGVSFRRVSEAASPNHVREFSRRGASPEDLEAELLNAVQNLSRSLLKLPVGLAKHIVQADHSSAETPSHRTKNPPEAFEVTHQQNSREKATRTADAQYGAYILGSERSEKAAQGRQMRQKLAKQNDSGKRWDTSRTMDTGLTGRPGDASNKRKTEPEQRGTQTPSKGPIKTLILDTMQTSKDSSIKQSRLTGMGGFDSRKRKGKFAMTSKDDTATEGSETKPQKDRKQMSKRKQDVNTCHKSLADSGGSGYKGNQMRLGRSFGSEDMDESKITVAKTHHKNTLINYPRRILGHRDSYVQDTVPNPSKAQSKDDSRTPSHPCDAEGLAGTQLPGSFMIDSTRSFPDKVLQPRKQAMGPRQNVDIEGKPFAEVLADIEDGSLSNQQTIATETATEDDSKLGITAVCKERDNNKETIKSFPRRITSSTEGTSEVLLAETTCTKNKVAPSFPVIRMSVPSDDASKETARNLHPFCSSEEGPLIVSESTSLSFVSSRSSFSELHRPTDLEGLSRLEALEVPTKETGDGKFSASGAMPTSAVQTCDFNISQLGSLQAGYGENRTSRLSINARQSSTATEHSCNEHILRATLMASQHDISEQTASLKRPALTLSSTLDETEYIWHQISNSPDCGARTTVRPLNLPSDPAAPNSPKLVESEDLGIISSHLWGRSPDCEEHLSLSISKPLQGLLIPQRLFLSATNVRRTPF